MEENPDDIAIHHDMDIDGLEEEGDIYATIKRIISNDNNLVFMCEHIPWLRGMDPNQLKIMLMPMMGIVEKHGVEVFSAGNPIRAEKIKGLMGKSNVYVSMAADFIPLFQTIVNTIKENKKSTQTDISDEDWASMPFSDVVEDEDQQQQEQQQRTNGVDESFLQRPSKTTYSGRGSMGSHRRKDILTMEQIVKNHQRKYGNQGLKEVVSEIGNAGINIDIHIEETPGVANSRTAQTLDQRQAALYGVELPKDQPQQVIDVHAEELPPEPAKKKKKKSIHQDDIDFFPE